MDLRVVAVAQCVYVELLILGVVRDVVLKSDEECAIKSVNLPVCLRVVGRVKHIPRTKNAAPFLEELRNELLSII